MSISLDISRNIACERKSKKSLLLLNIALDQSARMKSLNYCKNSLVRLSSSWSKDPVLNAALALKTLGCLCLTKSEKTIAFVLKNN